MIVRSSKNPENWREPIHPSELPYGDELHNLDARIAGAQEALRDIFHNSFDGRNASPDHNGGNWHYQALLLKMQEMDGFLTRFRKWIGECADLSGRGDYTPYEPPKEAHGA